MKIFASIISIAASRAFGHAGGPVGHGHWPLPAAIVLAFAITLYVRSRARAKAIPGNGTARNGLADSAWR